MWVNHKKKSEKIGSFASLTSLKKESDPVLDPEPDPDLQRYGSGDPDPSQIVTDPQHCSLPNAFNFGSSFLF
jgi:hypothetical protein